MSQTLLNIPFNLFNRISSYTSSLKKVYQDNLFYRLSGNAFSSIDNSRGKSIDDIYQIAHKIYKQNNSFIQNAEIQVLSSNSGDYFDKYSVIRLTFRNEDKTKSVSKDIKLDSEVFSGNDYITKQKHDDIYKFNLDKLKLQQQAKILSVKPILQFGATCKLVTLGQILEYYLQDKATPVYKNSHGRYSKYMPKNISITSIRELAKKIIGSLQGEILDYRLFIKLAEHLGLNAKVEEPKSLDEYRKSIVYGLENKQGLATFFSVSTRDRSHSNVFTKENSKESELFEHIAMVTGYDPNTDKVRLTHWGNHYWQPISDVYTSSCNLVETRSIEYYKLLKSDDENYKPEWKYKQITPSEYEAIKQSNQNIEVKVTPQPEQGTGFKGKLITLTLK
ncbi:MAG: hypothetical protein RLZZ210_713 [Pseudomonadota bacterium]